MSRKAVWLRRAAQASVAMGFCFAATQAAWAGSNKGPTGKPILVGLIAGTTGAYGTTGVATVRGAKLAVAYVNAHGGVLGRPLKLESYNDGASATLSGELFKKLVSNGAVAIVGSPDTGPVTAELAVRYRIPDIGDVDDGGLTVYKHGPSGQPNPWVFDFGLNTFAWGKKIGEYAVKHCEHGLAVLHDPTTYGRGGFYGIKEAYDAASKKIRIDKTITEDWSTGATKSLTPEINAIEKAGVKCVDVWLTPQDQAAFARQSHSLGAQFQLFGNDESNSDNTYASLAGAAANGTISAMLTADMNPSASLKAFSTKYEKEFHAKPTPFAETTYDSILMLAKAITEAKSTSHEKVKAAFNGITNFNGLTGSLSFSPQKHVTIDAEQLSLVRYDAKTKRWEHVE